MRSGTLIDLDYQTEAFGLLEARGVTKAVVDYSGGNDSGGADTIMLTLADGTQAQLERHWWHPRDTPALGDEALAQREADNALWVLLERPIDDEYGSFAGEFETHGTVVWDVAERSMVMDDHCEYDIYEDDDDDEGEEIEL